MAVELGEVGPSVGGDEPSDPAASSLAEAGLEVVITEADGVRACVRLAGELDLATVSRAAEELAAAAACGCVWVEIDAGNLRFCDSMGLRCLLEARERCVSSGGGLHVVAPQAQLARLLEIVGLETLLLGSGAVSPGRASPSGARSARPVQAVP